MIFSFSIEPDCSWIIFFRMELRNLDPFLMLDEFYEISNILSVFGGSIDPLLKNLDEKKQRFRQNAVSLAAELKEEAERKVKKMEEEICRLQERLEERDGQLQASASAVEKVLLHHRNLPHVSRSINFGNLDLVMISSWLFDHSGIEIIMIH
ncbi:hypothetical protein CDL15_Pgr004866 [Punica granatum]|uniref:Uncharacterized protein n=1 Tax=Punica granatum TaxID=22663 RepID=A0A218W681_PUNGR|nr:hypothetical protein CDL15_Pgr004866 [Punica granatum]